jgi:hypothetical protein
MSRMSPTLRALLIGALATVPVVLVGKALGFDGLAWFGVLLAMMFFTSLFDREGFYGPRKPR